MIPFFHHRFHTLKVLTKAEYTAVGYLVRRVQFEMEEQWAKVVDVSHRHSWKCAISWLRPTTCWHPVAPSDFEEEDRWGQDQENKTWRPIYWLEWYGRVLSRKNFFKEVWINRKFDCSAADCLQLMGSEATTAAFRPSNRSSSSCDITIMDTLTTKSCRNITCPAYLVMRNS